MRIIKPVFGQDEATLAADSANFNQHQNTFNAFGNVVINQNNSTQVYADLLDYDGNKKIALLTNNVRLVDKDATLTTDHLTYNTATKIGTYLNGGKITDTKNILTSTTGYYFTNTGDAYFKHNVVLTSPEVVIKSDTLRYNSRSKIAYFYGPTRIYGKDDTLYTENGSYNTITEQAFFGKNNLYTQGTKSLQGDSLFFDRKKGYGRAINNITFTDEAQKTTLKGNLGIYRKNDESILATKNAYVVLRTQSNSKVDSIWMTADTLFSKVVLSRTIQAFKPPQQKQDSEVDDNTTKNVDDGPEIKTPKEIVSTNTLSSTQNITNSNTTTLNSPNSTPDTTKTRLIFAYHKAKIFKSDLQAKMDSIFFSSKDSVIRCYKNPMIWSQGSQFSADTIYLQLKHQQLHNILLHRNAFIVNNSIDIDSTKFNQVKGKVISGYFKNNKLHSTFVDGNAESVYYLKEEGKTTFSGMNKMISSRIKVVFENGELQKILFIRKPEGTYYPIGDIFEEDTILPGFIWKPKERPKSKEEIIPTLAKPKADPAPKKTPNKAIPRKKHLKK